MLDALDRELNKEEYSPRFVEFYRKLLQSQSWAEQSAIESPPDLPPAAVADRLGQGLPLLSFEELPLNWEQIREVFSEIANTFAAYPEFFEGVPQSLPQITPALLKEIARTWYEGGQLPDAIAGSEATAHLFEAIVHATLRPFLVSYARKHQGKFDQERWRRGYCPVCGGSPDLSYLEKENGARWLLCSRCDTAWLFQRLQCPYCNTTDQNALSYYTDDVGRYRLYICEQCHQYLKTVDLRQSKADIVLPLERLFTLNLDIQAHEQGYSPAGSKVVSHH
jgi:FdhE protein